MFTDFCHTAAHLIIVKAHDARRSCMCSMQLSLHTVQGCADYTPHIPSLTTSLKALFVLTFFHAHSFIASLLPPPHPPPPPPPPLICCLVLCICYYMYVKTLPCVMTSCQLVLMARLTVTHNSVSAFSDYDLSYLFRFVVWEWQLWSTLQLSYLVWW